MKLRDLHKDVEHYLLKKCYCRGEIYSFDGFFFQVFFPNYKCEKLGENKSLIASVSYPQHSKGQKVKPSILLFFKNEPETRIVNALRVDATDNNLKVINEMLQKDLKDQKFKFDEYDAGSTARTLKEVLSLSSAVMIV